MADPEVTLARPSRAPVLSARMWGQWVVVLLLTLDGTRVCKRDKNGISCGYKYLGLFY